MRMMMRNRILKMMRMAKKMLTMMRMVKITMMMAVMTMVTSWEQVGEVSSPGHKDAISRRCFRVGPPDVKML